MSPIILLRILFVLFPDGRILPLVQCCRGGVKNSYTGEMEYPGSLWAGLPISTNNVFLPLVSAPLYMRWLEEALDLRSQNRGALAGVSLAESDGDLRAFLSYNEYRTVPLGRFLEVSGPLRFAYPVIDPVTSEPTVKMGKTFEDTGGMTSNLRRMWSAMIFSGVTEDSFLKDGYGVVAAGDSRLECLCDLMARPSDIAEPRAIAVGVKDGPRWWVKTLFPLSLTNSIEAALRVSEAFLVNHGNTVFLSIVRGSNSSLTWMQTGVVPAGA